jgi:hypothetical protein
MKALERRLCALEVGTGDIPPDIKQWLGWSLTEAERQQLGSPQHNLPIDPAALDKETRERLGV